MKFSLPYQVLVDICRVLSKMSDNDSVIFSNDSHNFLIYAKSTEFYTEYRQDPFCEVFSFSVKSENLVSIVKKLSKKFPVSFEVQKSRLLVKQGEAESKLPVADPSYGRVVLQDLTKYDDLDFLESLEFCAKAVKEDKRFRGVLVKKIDKEVTKIVKLGFASCAVSGIISEAPGCPAIVIPAEAALVLKGFKKTDKKGILINDNAFGVVLSSGAVFYTMLLDNTLPEDLFEMFGSPDGPNFIVNRKDLVSILESIHAVMGTDETGVMWSRIPDSEISWKLSCKTYKGVEVSESLQILSGSLENASDFGLHRKALLEVLKALTSDEITLWVGTRAFVYITAGNNTVAFTKFGG